MEETRQKLIHYAYTILGSLEDAKDIAQETIKKFLAMERDHIKDPSNYQIKMVINEAINFKNRNKRSVRYGTWLPEPVETPGQHSSIEKEQIINYALLVLFEKLNARERAVFVFKEAFGFDHRYIAELLEISPDNSRQLLARAKKKVQIRSGVQRPATKIQSLEPYMAAIKDRDVAALEDLLAHDVELQADGGDSIQVVTARQRGRDKVIPLVLHVYKAFQQGQQITYANINHQPALLYHDKGSLVNCQVFTIREGKIVQIFSVLNPSKLKYLSR
ncbi:sigma-70 family RNA polymerase sigma factor [Muricauda sp. NFXS6]|uniref:sigma-70 family RNA polymerase sigma factor n=1 Tax=Allomuricauda sp. NFXS6 TaxID=2819094 RepID=UPI0032DF0BFE